MAAATATWQARSVRRVWSSIHMACTPSAGSLGRPGARAAPRWVRWRGAWARAGGARWRRSPQADRRGQRGSPAATRTPASHPSLAPRPRTPAALVGSPPALTSVARPAVPRPSPPRDPTTAYPYPEQAAPLLEIGRAVEVIRTPPQALTPHPEVPTEAENEEPPDSEMLAG